jgi:GeoRSP system SPASM domain protein
MNLKELSSPIRMYWDIGSGALSESDCRRIAGEIAACKILTLQITETSSAVSPSCLSVLDALKNKNVALSLVLPLSAWDQEALRLVHDFPVKLLLISMSSISQLGSVVDIQHAVAGKPLFGIAFGVRRGNVHELPEVLTFCIVHKVQHVVLPMQRLAGNEEAFFFSGEERTKLTARLNKIETPAWLRIIIHDPFLWRAFFPSTEFPDGGCQAANTMLFISPSGDVYPCPTLPVKIGNLQTASLRDVIASDVKKEVRRSILGMPDDCSGCPDLKQCKAGCRGRAYALKGWEGPDPSCS